MPRSCSAGSESDAAQFKSQIDRKSDNARATFEQIKMNAEEFLQKAADAKQVL